MNASDIKFAFSLAKLKQNKNSKNKRLNKLYKAVIIKDNKQFKAKLLTFPIANYIDIPSVLDLTKDSFNLKYKTHIFTKETHPILIIRSEFDANLNPGSDAFYVSILEGIVINGYITKINNEWKFDYKYFISKRLND